MNSISSSVLVVHCIKSADGFGFTQIYFSASKPVYIVHIQKLPRSVIDHAGFLSIAMGLVQEHVCILVVDFSYFFFRTMGSYKCAMSDSANSLDVRDTLKLRS